MKLKKRSVNKKVKAIIWDLDGVLIDSENLHRLAEIKTMNFFNVKLTKEIAKEYSGFRLSEYFLKLKERFNADFNIEKALERHHQILNQLFSEKVLLVKNAREVLKELKKGFKMALATISRESLAKIILDKFSLWKYFDVTVFGDLIINPKPDPEIFLEAAYKLGAEPTQAVVIEDSKYGFQAAKVAGMLLIARKANHNSHLDFSMADYVVEDLRDIPKIVKRLN